MTKQDLETRFQEYHQEQQTLAAEVAQKSALIQQLEGKKQLVREMHTKLAQAENKIVALPDPPKENEQAQDTTPAS